MALVAYEMSDASGSEDEEESSAQPVVKKTEVKTERAASSQSNDSQKIVAHAPETDLDIDDGIVDYDAGTSRIFSDVPEPKRNPLLFDSDKLKKLLLNQPAASTAGKNERKVVKISVPSLSEFEEELPRPLAAKPTQAKGSGLFSLLPPPKHSGTAATLKLMPDSVKRPLVPKVVLKPPVKLPRPVVVSPIVAAPVVEDDSDDDDTGDFFSLNKEPEPVPDVSLPTPIEELLVPEAAPEQVDVQEPADHYEPGDFVPVASENLELDEEAMQRLCGGNKRKRNALQAELIDVSEKDVVPDKNEWLMKALTEEKRTRSHKKGLGPSSTQKRKHQITYLAYQAKEQEQDLQNQWATNRMTKKQTQSKYGF